jgi:peptide methionine sulfoxide reductase MsrB
MRAKYTVRYDHLGKVRVEFFEVTRGVKQRQAQKMYHCTVCGFPIWSGVYRYYSTAGDNIHIGCVEYEKLRRKLNRSIHQHGKENR